jgi:hypothetical protein
MSTISKGWRRFVCDNEKIVYIHDFESWTESKLWEFLNKKY